MPITSKIFYIFVHSVTSVCTSLPILRVKYPFTLTPARALRVNDKPTKPHSSVSRAQTLTYKHRISKRYNKKEKLITTHRHKIYEIKNKNKKQETKSKIIQTGSLFTQGFIGQNFHCTAVE